jgi:hypothetical protein
MHLGTFPSSFVLPNFCIGWQTLVVLPSLHQSPNFAGCGILPVAAIPCHTLAPFHFLDLIYSLITMYNHNRCWGNTSRNRSHNTDLSIYGPQVGCFTIVIETMVAAVVAGGGSGTRFALHDDDDVTTDDALCSGHPIWHAPGELARDSGSMPLGTSLLQGSHCGSNHNGGIRRYALPNDDGDDATDDALHLGHPIRHAPGELTRDSGSMLSGASLLQGSYQGRNCSGGNGGGATRFALRDDDDITTGDSLVQGVLFGMHLVNLQETQVVCHQAHPCFKCHNVVGNVLETMVAAEDFLCAMMMTMPLVMPFIWGVLFSMHLVNLQET